MLIKASNHGDHVLQGPRRAHEEATTYSTKASDHKGLVLLGVDLHEVDLQARTNFLDHSHIEGHPSTPNWSRTHTVHK